MFGQISDDDRRVTPYKVHKSFSIQYYDGTDTATDLGVFPLHAVSGSTKGNPGFVSQSAATTTYVSGGASYEYYKIPLWNQINANFFEFARVGNRKAAKAAQPQFIIDNGFPPFGRGKGHSSGKYEWQVVRCRELHDEANVISIPQKLYGERIRTGSISLVDYSGNVARTIKDDGYGNLYDNTYYTQFSGSAPTAKGSGSAIGTVSYDHGLIMITDTGSYSNTGGTDSGSNGWTLNFDSTKTIYEHEYTCIVPEGQFNNSTNISVSLNRSGSLTVPAGLDMNPMRDIVSAPGESYYNTGSGYTATTQTENFATHSAFMPYITTVGLYNDHGDLLAIAKTSRPIKNDTELALSFIVRFDI